MTDEHSTTSTERGSALIMALVFTGVVSLVVVALLGLTQTNLRTTRVVETHTDQLYAADAGLQHAIEALRLDRTYCPTTGSTETLPDVVIDGTNVDLTCRTTSGSSSGAEGWAVIATSTASQGGIVTGGASSQPKVIEGPVYAARLEPFSSGGLTVNGGSVYEQQGVGCTSSSSAAPSGLTVAPTPPFSYRCTTDSVPVVAHGLPTARPAAPAAFTDVVLTSGTCRVFFPGTYTTAPALSTHNYFASGVYYFENVGLWEIKQADVIGGQRDPLESSINGTVTPCNDYTEDASFAGTGVKWIFGGTSAIDVRNQAEIELYSRSGGGSSEGQQAISMQAVLAAEASPGVFIASAPAGTYLVDVSNGNTAEFTSHGLVHAPSSNFNFVATNDSRAQLRGGIVIGRIEMSASASASGLVVSVRSSPEVRQMVVTARVPGAAGSVAVEAVAVLRLDNNTERTFSIESWRTGRDTTP